MPFSAENARASDLLDPVREVLQDDEVAQEYLTTRWISKAMLALRRARRQSGLSQADVAQKMSTKQPSIARLEGDDSGGVSLRRYAEYMAACGVTPFDIELVGSEQLRAYLLEDPGASVLTTKFKQWLAFTLMEEEGRGGSTEAVSRSGKSIAWQQGKAEMQSSIVPFPGLQNELRRTEECIDEIAQSSTTGPSLSRSRQQVDSSALVAA